MKQYPVELHSHTNHSDGDFEVEELVAEAINFGYKGLILTDHNTTSGAEEVIEKGLDKDIVFLKGMEWTTYFGHMLVHDVKRVIDWREARVDTIDSHMEEVKEAGGLIGIAHPFQIGSPICTGCFWEFQVTDWTHVNYIELWNKTNPHNKYWSEEAYNWWCHLLKEGHRVACSAGRDWHRLEGKGMFPGVTYVQTEEDWSNQAMKNALDKGAMYITLSPRIEVTLSVYGQTYSFGDEVPMREEYELEVELLSSDLVTLSNLDIEATSIRVISQEQVVLETENITEKHSWKVGNISDYLRVEVIGRYLHQKNVRLLITSPIYIK